LGSFQNSAAELHLTQPAVSKQIRALENGLGERLFERGRAIKLTYAGEVLLKYAEQVAHLVRSAGEEIADLQDAARGRIAVGVSHSVAAFLLPSLLESYRRRYPEVAVSIRAGWPPEIIKHVLARDLDLAVATLVASKPADSVGLTCVPLAVAEMVFVAYPGEPLARMRRLSFRDLRGAAWILNQDGCQYRGYLERRFAQLGVKMNIAVEVVGAEMQKKLVQLGFGITLLPKPFVAAELKEGKLKALKVIDAKLKSYTSLIYRKDKYIHGAMRGFLGLLRKAAGAN
jgi:DNA-binding transcriptional LysR family regulator